MGSNIYMPSHRCIIYNIENMDSLGLIKISGNKEMIMQKWGTPEYYDH